MKRPQEFLVGRRWLCVKLVERKRHRPHSWLEPSGVHKFNRRVIAVAVHRLELHDVTRLEEDHEVAEVRLLLFGVVDRHWRDAKELIAAGPANGIDASETAAVADGELWRVGSRPQVFR